MNLKDSYNRILSRRPWHIRIYMRAYGKWIDFVNWIKDCWYGAPWESK